jgi:hypothetical protein
MHHGLQSPAAAVDKGPKVFTDQLITYLLSLKKK